MTIWRRILAPTAIAVTVALSISGCASTGVSVTNAGEEQLAPVQTGSVSTTALPPIGPNGEVQGPITDPNDPNAAQMGDPLTAPSDEFQTANADGSFDTLQPVGALPNSSGRDLSGGLTVEKLLGRWTIVSGADQCQLNLTQTTKAGTSRYRASSPACAVKTLSVVASWTLAGSQVQLFDENGDMIAALILSGNRFIGSLTGGQGISMVG
ncbi:MAG TPA: AprI/Inh family metalloprotease inhibitor [Devosia sp.]|nr:AprI/Inh family metalloprotease inhibitor [Devosia sp.]